MKERTNAESTKHKKFTMYWWKVVHRIVSSNFCQIIQSIQFDGSSVESLRLSFWTRDFDDVRRHFAQKTLKLFRCRVSESCLTSFLHLRSHCLLCSNIFVTTIKSNVTKTDLCETTFKLIITNGDSSVRKFRYTSWMKTTTIVKAKRSVQGLLCVMHINVIRAAFYEICRESTVSYRSMSARRHAKFDEERLSDQRDFLHPKRAETESDCLDTVLSTKTTINTERGK